LEGFKLCNAVVLEAFKLRNSFSDCERDMLKAALKTADRFAGAAIERGAGDAAAIKVGAGDGERLGAGDGEREAGTGGEDRGIDAWMDAEEKSVTLFFVGP